MLNNVYTTVVSLKRRLLNCKMSFISMLIPALLLFNASASNAVMISAWFKYYPKEFGEMVIKMPNGAIKSVEKPKLNSWYSLYIDYTDPLPVNKLVGIRIKFTNDACLENPEQKQCTEIAYCAGHLKNPNDEVILNFASAGNDIWSEGPPWMSCIITQKDHS